MSILFLVNLSCLPPHNITFSLSTECLFHRFCEWLGCWNVPLSPQSFTCSWIRINTHFMFRNFEKWISNKVTFLLDTAEPLQWECFWSPDDVGLVIVNPLFPFLHWLLWGEQANVCWGCGKPYTIPSNKPLWDLHEHCCKCLQAVCKMRAQATFWRW